jgi:hypothetical protein
LFALFKGKTPAKMSTYIHVLDGLERKVFAEKKGDKKLTKILFSGDKEAYSGFMRDNLEWLLQKNKYDF